MTLEMTLGLLLLCKLHLAAGAFYCISALIGVSSEVLSHLHERLSAWSEISIDLLSSLNMLKEYSLNKLVMMYRQTYDLVVY